MGVGVGEGSGGDDVRGGDDGDEGIGIGQGKLAARSD